MCKRKKIKTDSKVGTDSYQWQDIKTYLTGHKPVPKWERKHYQD
jgi:hypothetical protein